MKPVARSYGIRQTENQENCGKGLIPESLLARLFPLQARFRRDAVGPGLVDSTAVNDVPQREPYFHVSGVQFPFSPPELALLLDEPRRGRTG